MRYGIALIVIACCIGMLAVCAVPAAINAAFGIGLAGLCFLSLAVVAWLFE